MIKKKELRDLKLTGKGLHLVSFLFRNKKIPERTRFHHKKKKILKKFSVFPVIAAMRVWWQKELMIGQKKGNGFTCLPQDPVIPPLGAYPREVTRCVHRDV